MGLGGRKRVRSHRDWKEGAAKGGGGGWAVRLAARGRNRCPSGGSTHPAVDAPRSPWPEVGGGTHVERARARPLTLLVDELRTAGPTRSIYGTRAWDWSVMWGRDGALKQLSSACGQWTCGRTVNGRPRGTPLDGQWQRGPCHRLQPLQRLHLFSSQRGARRGIRLASLTPISSRAWSM